jgi:O-antigen/teichoic acid export membrane protein
MSVAEAGPKADAPSLGRRAVRATVWVAAGQGAGHAIRFAANLVLTRFLAPEAFGVMAVVNSAIVGLHLFSDFGIRATLIQHPRGDERTFLDTAWTVQVLRGAALSVAALAIAWPAAALYGLPELRVLLPVAGIGAFVHGLGPTKLLAIDRHLHPARGVLIHVGTAVLGAATMLAWVAVRPEIWALVAGGLVTSAGRTLLGFLALPGASNRFCWDPEARRAFVSFGRWIFLSTIATFLAMQADRLVFGLLAPMAVLGVYSIGQALTRLPVELVESIAHSVTFPVYSRVRERGGDLARAYSGARLPLVWLGGISLSFLALLGPALVAFLYDDRYRDAGWIVQVVAGACLFQVLSTTIGDALLALGKPQWTAAANGAKVAAMAVLIPVGHRAFGFPGALAGFAAAEVPKYLVLAVRAGLAGLRGRGTDLAVIAAFAACAAILPVSGRFLAPGPALGLAAAGFAAVWALLTAQLAKAWLRVRAGTEGTA